MNCAWLHSLAMALLWGFSLVTQFYNTLDLKDGSYRLIPVPFLRIKKRRCKLRQVCRFFFYSTLRQVRVCCREYCRRNMFLNTRLCVLS